jgi:hypothetical protein
VLKPLDGNHGKELQSMLLIKMFLVWLPANGASIAEKITGFDLES